MCRLLPEIFCSRFFVSSRRRTLVVAVVAAAAHYCSVCTMEERHRYKRESTVLEQMATNGNDCSSAIVKATKLLEKTLAKKALAKKGVTT